MPAIKAPAAGFPVTLSVTEGTLTVTPGGSGALVSNSGTSSVTITGTVTQINDLLAKRRAYIEAEQKKGTARDGFDAMVAYTAPVFWLFFFLTGMSLFVFRRWEPHASRPYQVPLYPVTPLLFCGVCIYMLYSSLAYTGRGALVGVGVLVIGAVLVVFNRRKS